MQLVYCQGAWHKGQLLKAGVAEKRLRKTVFSIFRGPLRSVYRVADSGTRHFRRGVIPRAKVLSLSHYQTQDFLAVAKFTKLSEDQTFKIAYLLLIATSHSLCVFLSIPKNVTSIFFNTVHLLRKDLRFEYGGRQTCFLPRAPSNFVMPLSIWRLVPSRKPIHSILCCKTTM